MHAGTRKLRLFRLVLVSAGRYNSIASMASAQRQNGEGDGIAATFALVVESIP